MSNSQEPVLSTQEQTQEEPKNSQKNQSKKINSYTYWVDQNNKSRTLPPEQQPQKIDPPKLVSQKSDDGRSDWNSAGTWQHKKITLEEIQNKYTQKLNKWAEQNCPKTKVKKVQLKGECQIIFTSKKKAVTYEINGKVEFQKTIEEEKKQKETSQQNGNKNEQVKQSNTDKKQIESVSQSSSSDKQTELKEKPVKKTTKAKPQTMTFQIKDLTDHGDREFSSKADNAEDKKFIASKSQKLMGLLEQVLKSYK